MSVQAKLAQLKVITISLLGRLIQESGKINSVAMKIAHWTASLPCKRVSMEDKIFLCFSSILVLLLEHSYPFSMGSAVKTRSGGYFLGWSNLRGIF